MKISSSKKQRGVPEPVIEYHETIDPEKLSRAFSLLFEEVMRRRKLSTVAKASLNN